MPGDLSVSVPLGQLFVALIAALVGVVWWNLNDKIKYNNDLTADKIKTLEIDIRERIAQTVTASSNNIDLKFKAIEDTIRRHDESTAKTAIKIDALMESVSRLEIRLASGYVKSDEMEELRAAFNTRGDRIKAIEAEVFGRRHTLADSELPDSSKAANRRRGQ